MLSFFTTKRYRSTEEEPTAMFTSRSKPLTALSWLQCVLVGPWAQQGGPLVGFRLLEVINLNFVTLCYVGCRNCQTCPKKKNTPFCFVFFGAYRACLFLDI